ncbi:DUF3311 domain-containing protein [Bacillus salipaludis]|uniref:DUF3311 domain-containing protein n=1 Tax=Bacillus salipaludis TaxID=2547811 RepID=A0A4R5VT11_9BACI|nr:DUF3311 domain-containing protein [Bacillus salipaludis]MDQ6598451.1 DUF3311 domain-containing protein [Bacillus salipaludis]TDK60990.1 DUF3311 domain-containing protein [Bacillus salipaludis]
MGKKTIIAILSMVPIVFMIVAIPFVNRIQPIIFGLPFLAFWLFLGMIITPLCTFLIFRLQKSERSTES